MWFTLIPSRSSWFITFSVSSNVTLYPPVPVNFQAILVNALYRTLVWCLIMQKRFAHTRLRAWGPVLISDVRLSALRWHCHTSVVGGQVFPLNDETVDYFVPMHVCR